MKARLQLTNLIKRYSPILLILFLVVSTSEILAQNPSSEEQCLLGINLHEEGKIDEALPLLEAGYTSRGESTFSDPVVLGRCALAFAIIQQGSRNWEISLEAFNVAMEIFSQTEQKSLEAVAANYIGNIYKALGQNENAIAIYEIGLAIVEQLEDQVGRAAFLNNIGGAYENLGRYNEALNSYESSLEITLATGYKQGEAVVRNNLGLIYYSQGSFEEALDQFTEALAIHQQLENSDGEAHSLNNIGLIFYSQGKFEEALVKFEEALVIRQATGNRIQEGVTLNNIGEVYQGQGEFEKAYSFHQDALIIAREMNILENESSALKSIAGINVFEGNYLEAIKNYETALANYRGLNQYVNEGYTLANLGDVYLAQGRYLEAMEIYDQALAILSSVRNRAGEGRLLNKIGNINYFLGKQEEAITKFEESLEIAQEIGDREAESIALNSIGLSLTMQGRYEDALVILFESLEIAQEIGDVPSEVTLRDSLGRVYKAQGHYELALSMYEAGLSIAQEIGDKEGEGTLTANMAGLFEAQGNYQNALINYETALKIMRDLGNRPGEGRILNNIGNIYYHQNLYGKALEYLEFAFLIKQDIGDLAGIAESHNSFGLVYDSQGQFEKALVNFEEAATIFKNIGDISSERSTFNNIANIYAEQGKIDEAASILQESVVVFHEIGDLVGESSSLLNLGLVLNFQGRHQEALQKYQDALSLYIELDDLEGQSKTLHNLAGVFYAQNMLNEASEIYEEALAIKREIGDLIGEAETLNNLGVVRYAQGFPEAALEIFEEAEVIFESFRTVSGNELARAGFIERYNSLYYRMLDISVQMDLFEKAFYVSEQGRARSFGDMLETGKAQFINEEVISLIETENTSYNAFVSAQDALIRSQTINPSDPDLVAGLEVQLSEAESAHNEALQAIEERQDQLAVLVPGSRGVLSLSEVQSFLNEQSTLVSFWVLGERTIAFIITHNQIDVVPIAVRNATLNTQIIASHDFTEIDSAYPEANTTLYQTLIVPILPYLNTAHLIIIPHQALHYVPFAALTDGEKYLMDDFNITYLPNASMLQHLPSPDEQPVYETALILGNPAADSMDELDFPLTDLPNTEQSAQIIAELFDTTPLLVAEATETAVRDNVSTANILHIGAHGRFNTIAPMQSALYLTPGEDETDFANNGRLQVDEVYGLPLDNIELVVLSACETNLGFLDRDNPLNNISAGDEIVSLNRAFLFQAPTVISTLWTVDDAATSLLMERFYTYLLEGKSKADSLRLAQLDVREEYPNPYYWAGFVLSGDGGNIDAALLSEHATNTQLPPETTAENNLTDYSSNIETTAQGEPETKITPIVWLLPVVLVIVVGGFILRRRRNGV